MATMTISLPDPMKDWVEAQVGEGDYASASDYVRDLIRRDRARREYAARHERAWTLEELREKLDESRASGISQRTVDEIFAEAVAIAEARAKGHG